MEYYQLSSEKQEIRLLKLVGDKDSDHVSCKLKCYRLDRLSKYKYTALSYHWGDSRQTTAITVDGVEVQVTKTLEAALYQLQVDGYHRVWADAICIDQTDDEEKSEQILHMRTVYSMARSVVVWLGPESKSSRATMEYIGKVNAGKLAVKDMLGTRSEDDRRERRSSRSPSISSSNSGGTRYSWLDKTIDRGVDRCLKLADEDARAGLKEFFERPYWRRVWIIQEIVSAARITVYCGQDRTEMRDIERLLVRTPEGKELLRSGKVPDFPAFQPDPKGKSSHLLKMVMNSRASEFTNPRDKIFALRGMASDGEALIPVPDYNKPVEVVFEEFARTLLGEKKCGNILIFRPPDVQPEDRSRLPSWVPDWSKMASSYRPWHSVLAGRDFCASYCVKEPKNSTESKSSRKKRTIKLDPRYTFYDKLMKVRGYAFDEIDGLSAQHTNHGPITEDERARRDFSNPRSKGSIYGEDEDEDEVVRAIASCLRMKDVDFGPLSTSWDNNNLGGSYIDVFADMLLTENEVLRSWLEANEGFLVYGNSLKHWIQRARQVRKAIPAFDDENFKAGFGNGNPEKEDVFQLLGMDRRGLFGEFRETSGSKGTNTGFGNGNLEKEDVFQLLGMNRRGLFGEFRETSGSKGKNTGFALRTTNDVLAVRHGRTAKIIDCGMRLGTTREGRVVMVHPQARRGDLVVCLPGCGMPVLLRRKDTGREMVYNVVGEAYVHPIRDWGSEFLGLDALDCKERVFFVE